MSFDFFLYVEYKNSYMKMTKKMLFTWHVSTDKHGGPVINRFRMSCVHITKLRCK
jgi:hypothetical protein